MVADYQSRLASADMELWQQVEKSVLLAPYWLDGHYISAQTAHRLGYTAVADAIRDEVVSFLAVCPRSLIFCLTTTPFVSEKRSNGLQISQVTSPRQSYR